MPLIAPDICRYTIVGSLAGQDCVNVFDIRITETGVLTRSEVLFEVAGDLLNQWSDHVLPQLTNDYTAEQVRWVDLDSADGGTGARSSTDGSTWPETGAGTSPPLPNNTYVKMVKVLEGKTRTQRNGALRLGGISEVDTLGANPNVLEPASIAAFNTAFEDLKDGINEGLGPYSVNLVVVHTIAGEYDGYSEIATYQCASTVGTLRRRMPGYGS